MARYSIDLREELGERAIAEAKRLHLNLAAWGRMIIGNHLDSLEPLKPYDDPSRKGRV